MCSQRHRWRKSRYAVVALITLGLWGCDGAQFRPTPSVSNPESSVSVSWDLSDAQTEQRLRHDVFWLADDERRGRGPHSAGLEQAAQFLRDEMLQLGAVGPLETKPAFQEFQPRVQWTMGESTRLAIHVDRETTTSLRPFEEFVVLPGSPSGELDVPLIFVGYGISAPELNYDDYQGIDVTGAAVVMLRHEPRLDDPTSPFAGRQLSDYGFLRSKIEEALRRGAKAVVLVTDQGFLNRRQSKGEETRDVLLSLTGKQSFDFPIPVLHAKRDVIDSYLRELGYSCLSELEEQIDQRLTPNSFGMVGSRWKGSIQMTSERESLKNVIGVLPGSGALASEYVVLGAHYDHLGMGGFGSLAPWTVAIHNGADDNASGTACLVEVARRLSQRETTSRRTLVLIAFSGEELGLLGSDYYCDHPVFPLKSIVAMLNLDMVGRLGEDGVLEVHGTGTAAGFELLANKCLNPLGLQARCYPDGFGPSDHASFYSHGIPVLHFFTGLHDDYHRPSDDPDTLDYAGMVRVVKAVETIAWELATNKDRPQPLDNPWFQDSASGLSLLEDAPAKPGRTWGIQLASNSTGVVVTRVLPGGLAAEMGLLRGDQLAEVGGKAIGDLVEGRRLLTESRPGDPLIIQRGTLRLKLPIPD